jgi:hypothetical protein
MRPAARGVRARRSPRRLGAVAVVLLVENASEEFVRASRELRDDIELLRKELDLMKDSWDTSLQRSQADVHWERLLAAVREEAAASRALRAGELVEAQAALRIRKETETLRESDRTVKAILSRMEKLHQHTRVVARRLQDVQSPLAAAREALDPAVPLAPEDRELYQAKLDVASRRLSEVHRMLKDGLTWFLQDERKAITMVTAGLRDLAELEATLFGLKRAIEEAIQKRGEASSEPERDSGRDGR